MFYFWELYKIKAVLWNKPRLLGLVRKRQRGKLIVTQKFVFGKFVEIIVTLCFGMEVHAFCQPPNINEK